MPQDKKYGGEDTELVIGDDNTIRESLHLQPRHGAGRRRHPDRFRQLDHGQSVHIAHDCHVGDHTILANNATLAGHVTLGDWVIIGGLSGVHQFCSMGAHAMAGGASGHPAGRPALRDLQRQPCAPHGINSEGLKRRGFDGDTINLLRRAYKVMYRDGKTVAEAVAALDATGGRGARVGRRRRCAARLRPRFAEGHHPLMRAPSSIAFVAGEASGDLLAAGY